MERFVLSIVVWVALWGEVNLANVLTGLVLAGALKVVFPSSPRIDHGVNPVGSLRFLGRFLVDLVTSSVAVARTVLRPSEERLNVKVVEIQLATHDPLLMSIICNAMTLTPGTMTVAVDESTSMMKLHVLGGIGDDDLRRQVHELEARVSAAVRRGPRRGGAR